MITLDDAPDFLLRSRLIDRRTVIEGNLEITSTTRRNRNLHIQFDGGGYLLKQPHDNAHESAGTLRREARFYRFCARHGACANLMPRLAHADESEGLVLVDLVRNAVPLWRYYRSRGAERFPDATAGALGAALADLHREGHAWARNVAESLDFLPRTPPFAFTLHRPRTAALAGMSGGAHAFIAALQRETQACARIDAVRAAWRDDTVVHGDIKMDNVLVVDPEAERAAGIDRIRLIDWEMAQWGDPAWDVGSVFQDFVFWWVVSMPQHEDHAQAAMASSFPIECLRAGAGAFWRRYSQDMDGAQADAFLREAIDHAACRMLQTAYEIASRFDHIPAPSRMLLQAGVNLIREPERGIDAFFQLRQEHAHAA